MAVAYDTVAERVESVAGRINWPPEDNRIPQEIFTDPELYELEQETLFRGPFWHLAGHEAELPEIGDFKTTDLGGVPIVIVRDKQREIRALVNACSHRGAQVVNECAGRAEKGIFRCIYHAWTFDLSGRCIGASLPESFPSDFRKEDFGLPKVRVTVYHGAIFLTLSDDTPPLEDYLGSVRPGLDNILGSEPMQFLGSQNVMLESNWKLLAENAYDGYHAILLHGAYKLLKLKARGEMVHTEAGEYYHGWGVLQPAGVDSSALLDTSILQSRTKAPGEQFYVMNVFPMSPFTNQLDTLLLRYVIPRGVDRAEYRHAYFAPASADGELLDHHVRQASNLWGPQGMISLEDGMALNRMQIAASARGDNVVLKGTPKRFPPYRLNDEAGIRDFYRCYRKVMGL